MIYEKSLEMQLKAAGLKLKSLRQEMLDHYLGRYDELIDSGKDHTETCEIIDQEISALDMKKLNADIFKIHHQNNIMISLVFFLLFSFLSVNLDFSDKTDPPSLWPIAQGDISSHFGLKVHPIHKKKMLHKGIDIKAAMGTKVVSPADGIVLESAYDNQKGHYLIIQHDDIYSTKYYHLSERLVEKGDRIKKEALIGKVGTSGMSTGPHLHYEVIKSGEAVDPIHFLKV